MSVEEPIEPSAAERTQMAMQDAAETKEALRSAQGIGLLVIGLEVARQFDAIGSGHGVLVGFSLAIWGFARAVRGGVGTAESLEQSEF